MTCHDYGSAALQAQYGGQGCTKLPVASTVVNSSNLPFTGSDIKLFVLLGLVLLVAGVTLYIAGRNKPSA